MPDKLVLPRFSTGDDPRIIAESMKKTLAEWLRRGLEKPGNSGMELSRRLCVGPSEVTKMKGGRRNLFAHQLFIISDYIEEPIPSHLGVPAKNAKQIQVIGEAGRNVWYDSEPTATGTMGFEPSEKYADLPHFAVRVVGHDVSACIPERMYAICVPYWEARKALTDKDFALIKLIRKDGSLHKRLIRQIHVMPDRHELHTAPARNGTDEPDVSRLLLADDLKHLRDGTGKVEITGLVVWQCGPLLV